MSEKWLTTKEAAEISGFHPEYLRELARSGKVTGRKIATVWQLERQSLMDYLKAGEASGDKRWGPRAD